MTDLKPCAAAALLLKLTNTLAPFAEVAEKLRHCHVVEICEPHPDNPSRNIVPMPREWFERAADDLEAITIRLHHDGVLSEGQASKLTGLDRVVVRKLSDAIAAHPTAVDAALGGDERSECNKNLSKGEQGEAVAPPHCQLCGGEVQGWHCQTCEAEFEEERGLLILKRQAAPPSLPGRADLGGLPDAIRDLMPVTQDFESTVICDAYERAAKLVEAILNHKPEGEG